MSGESFFSRKNYGNDEYATYKLHISAKSCNL